MPHQPSVVCRLWPCRCTSGVQPCEYPESNRRDSGAVRAANAAASLNGTQALPTRPEGVAEMLAEGCALCCSRSWLRTGTHPQAP